MNISSIIDAMLSMVDKSRKKLEKLPGLFYVCTCARRPGFSSIVASAEAYAEMHYVQEEYDDVVTEFTYNLINRIKENLQDDGVCFVAIPPGEIQLKLTGGNGGGPIELTGSNKNYVFTYAIIR